MQQKIPIIDDFPALLTNGDGPKVAHILALALQGKKQEAISVLNTMPPPMSEHELSMTARFAEHTVGVPQMRASHERGLLATWLNSLPE